MKQDYFHRVAALTPTKMWINNVTPPEAQWAIDVGAMGCTQNPAYTWKMLNHPDYKDDALRPYDWYRDLVLLGCRYHEFPERYMARIAAIDSIPDPDIARREQNEGLIERIRQNP